MSEPEMVPEEPDADQLQLDGVELSIGPGRLEELPIDLLPDGEMTPERGLIETVRYFGVMTPIVVSRTEDGTYHVIDGKRRVMSARRYNLETVSAKVYEADDLRAVATLLLNNQRSANPIADYDAIIALMAQGATTEEMSASSQVPRKLIERRLLLGQLNRTLYVALQQRAITLAVAEKVATQGPEVQERCEAHFLETGKLTAADVRNIIAELSGDGEPEAEQVSFLAGTKSWSELVAEAVEQAKESGVDVERLVAAVYNAWGSTGADDDEDA